MSCSNIPAHTSSHTNNAQQMSGSESTSEADSTASSEDPAATEGGDAASAEGEEGAGSAAVKNHMAAAGVVGFAGLAALFFL